MNERSNLRVGIGYDIHRAVPGRGLKLGGVSFPGAGFRLEGHSDADVILHALCDALLGAAGLPDIGQLFPNTDPRHRGRDSLEFLRAVSLRLKQAGYGVLNVDCTLLAQEPKIAAAVSRMRRRIGRALALPADQVNVKATTHERLGAIGRQEGLAAMAVALLQRQMIGGHRPRTARTKPG